DGGFARLEAAGEDEAEDQYRQQGGKAGAHVDELGDIADDRRADEEAAQRDEGQDGDIGRGRAIGKARRSRDGEREADGDTEPDDAESDERYRHGRGRSENGDSGKSKGAADTGQCHGAAAAAQPVTSEAPDCNEEGKDGVAEPGSAAGGKDVAQEHRRPVGNRALGHGDAENEEADAKQRRARQAPGRAAGASRGFRLGFGGVTWQQVSADETDGRGDGGGEQYGPARFETTAGEQRADEAPGHHAERPETVGGGHDQ